MPADALHGIQGVAGFSATTAGDAAAEAEAEADATVAVSSASAIQQRAAGLRTIIWILSGEERWGAWGQVGGGSWSLSDAVASPRSLLVRTAENASPDLQLIYDCYLLPWFYYFR